MLNYPWADSSASYLAGVIGPGWDGDETKTPLIPDGVFTVLSQRAWGIADDANHLLEMRDELVSNYQF